jgi:hypothetical protein
MFFKAILVAGYVEYINKPPRRLNLKGLQGVDGAHYERAITP